jgi:hypothetical protein
VYTSSRHWFLYSNKWFTTKYHILYIYLFYKSLSEFWGTWWRIWLMHCTTSRKVAGTIPYGVTGIFYWHNPSGHTMSLGSTQPLTEISTRNISWEVKTAGAFGWQSYHLQMPIALKSVSLNFLEPSGPFQTCNIDIFINCNWVVTRWQYTFTHKQ